MKRYLLCQIVIAFLMIESAFADYKKIDDFESYPFDAAMKAFWCIDDGADSQVTIDITGGIDQSKAMKWVHPGDSSYTPWVVWHKHVYNEPQDWSGFEKVSIMLMGDAANSASSIAWFEVLSSSGYSLAASYDTKLNHSDWQQIDIHIDPAKSWNNVGIIRFGFNHMGNPGLITRWDDLKLEMADFINIELVSSSLEVKEGGSFQEYSLSLAKPIDTDVKVIIKGNGQLLVDAGQGFADQTAIDFTSNDWGQPRTVKVMAIDDEAVEGDQLFSIIHQTQSSQMKYDGIIKEFDVTIKDNEKQCSVSKENAMLGDLNLDCYVDIQDFGLMAGQWLACSNPLYPGECEYIPHNTLRDKMLAGKSPQVDTTYLYYQNRSAESIASEIMLNGYDYVQLHAHYGQDHLAQMQPLIDEFHQNNLGVMAVFFAMCTYEPTAILPDGWQQWKVQFQQMQLPYNFLSPVHQDYIAWMKQRLYDVFADYDFDGFVFHETHWPVDFKYDNYCDVSPAFQDAFKNATGNDAFPNFVDSASPDYYLTDTDLYQDLIQYRIDVINDFYNDIVNGENGLRENFPDLLIATWTLATSWDNDRSVNREFYGQDAAAMVAQVRPDMHFFQSNWPDWANYGISPDYSKKYQTFVDSVRDVDSDLPLGLQLDVSFNKYCNWYDDVVDYANEAGMESTTYCEFSIRWDVYFEPPEPKRLVKPSSNKLKLYFDQRIAVSCSDLMLNRTIINSDEELEYHIIQASVDGNILLLELDEDCPAETILSIPVGGICDDPQFRFNLRYGEKDKGPQNTIPAGTFAYLTVETE